MFKFLSGVAIGVTAGAVAATGIIIFKALDSDTLRPYLTEAAADKVYEFAFGKERAKARYNRAYRDSPRYEGMTTWPGYRGDNHFYQPPYGRRGGMWDIRRGM